jgi:hypothetical protein
VIEASNIPRIEPLYNPGLIRIKIGSRPWVPADRIILSSRESTLFTYSTPGPWALAGNSDVMQVSFCSTEVSDCEHAATFNVTITKTPKPAVFSMFPQVVNSNEASTVTTTILYLNPATTLSSLSVRLIIPSADVSQRIAATSLTSLAPASCAYPECSKFNLVFNVPANPAGLDKAAEALVAISALGKDVNATLRYKASGTPSLERFSPRSAVLTSTVDTPVTIFLRNFPSAVCKDTSCSDEARDGNVKVLFDDVPGAIVPGSLADAGELLRLQVVPPSLTSARAASCAIMASDRAANEVSVSVGFTFTYTAPAPQLTPNEGVSTGQTLVTLTAVGFQRLASAQDLSLTLCSEKVSQLTIVDSVSAGNSMSSITVVFTTPDCAIYRARVAQWLYPPTKVLTYLTYIHKHDLHFCTSDLHAYASTYYVYEMLHIHENIIKYTNTSLSFFTCTKYILTYIIKHVHRPLSYMYQIHLHKLESIIKHI